MKGFSARRLTYLAVLTAVALTIFVIEAQLPPLAPIPGIKLGLANVVTVYAVFALGPGQAGLVLLARVLLGSLFAGGMTLFYSLAGGLCCYLVTLAAWRLLGAKLVWVCSMLGAMAHNAGQIAVAVAITRTPAVAAYLPILLASGIVTGLFTGLCAQFLLSRLPKPGPPGRRGP
ncbi:MAG TPA: Gx transporter family protein [Candidatus Enterenecus merdae]|nr:Gx transporter family protein [Candidatus Enterenecus merdae]